MARINIIPNVRDYIDLGENVKFSKLICNEKLTNYQFSLLDKYLSNDSKYELKFIKKDLLKEEGYEIVVNLKSVECYYSNEKGKHNAILTLRQLLMNKRDLTTCHIFDEPNFELRSIMIDISRNKVPKLSTLKSIVDELALVKINDLQLYVEGRSFYFESFAEYYENKDDFLTGEDVVELSKYALDRGIALTPNLNCYGHMAFWLNQKELSKYALKPEGFSWAGSNTKNYAQTIDSNNPKAQEMVLKMFDDMLKYYPDIDRCTIGGDEPFELMAPTRHPQSKEMYVNQLKKVIDHVHKLGKTPYMWADFAREYPEMMEELGEVVLLDWCYEEKWVDDNRMKIYKDHKYPFVVCPGVGAWSSFSGKMRNMFGNIKKYAELGRKYGAKGMILTDWNDGGSLAQVATQIACYVYGACYEWNDLNVDHQNVNEYLDKNIYHNKLAESVILLGDYYTMQDDVSNPYSYSKLFNMFFSHQLHGFNYDVGSYSDCAALNNTKNILNYNECEKVEKYLDEWIKDLKFTKENIYIKELMFEYKLIRHSLNLNKTYLKLRDFKASIEELKYLLLDINKLIKEHKKLWDIRNKKSDYKYSNYRFILLKKQYISTIKLLEDIAKFKGE